MPRARKSDVSGKRIYDKKHFCLYCGKPESKIARHLRLKHKEELLVKSIINSEDDQKQKHEKWDLLRYKGDYYHNLKILKIGGELVVWRRPAPDSIVDVKDYVPCEYCLVFITKKEMWRHSRKCPMRKDGNACSLKNSEMLLYPSLYCDGASDELKHLVLKNMIRDEVGNVVFRDTLITTYGSFQLSSCGLKKLHSISERMRLMARLLIQLRTETGQHASNLADFIMPEMFENVVLCTKRMGGYSMDTEEGEPVASFRFPSVPLKVGYTIEKCAGLLRSIGIKTRDVLVEQNAIKFLKLYEVEWGPSIATICLKTLGTNRFNKVQLLPVTDDLLKLRQFMKDGITIHRRALEKNCNLQNWRNLAEVLGCRLTIFNKRRVNEVFTMLLSRYENRKKWKDSELSEIKETLTPLEKKLMNR